MSYFPADVLKPPKKDELEITVFGPGYGESVVLHIPGIGWGVIDCCEFKTGTRTVNLPLEYLKNLALTEIHELAFIILTHPHKDHYKGIDTIIKSYSNRIKRICLYSGDGIRELKQYICQQKIAGKDALPGFAEILKAMNNATKEGAHLRRLSELTSVFDTPQTSLIALSPSALNIEKYIQKLFKAIPQTGKPVRPMNDDAHNLISVALLLKFGKVNVILGSDLETDKDRAKGWNAILYNDDCPDLKANLVKVAHHGSRNGYNKKAWDEHCRFNKPIAVITPFIHGNVRLPDEATVNILKEKVSKLCITAFPKDQHKISRYYRRNVATGIKSHTRNFKVIEPLDHAGFFRARFLSNGKLVENISASPSECI